MYLTVLLIPLEEVRMHLVFRRTLCSLVKKLLFSLKASSTEAEVCLELLSLSLVPGIIH